MGLVVKKPPHGLHNFNWISFGSSAALNVGISPRIERLDFQRWQGVLSDLVGFTNHNGLGRIIL